MAPYPWGSAQELHLSENLDTPVTFSREETEEIRRSLGGSAKAACPRCGGDLDVRGPVAGGGSVGPVFHVACAPCRRHAAVIEVPGSRPPVPRPKGN